MRTRLSAGRALLGCICGLAALGFPRASWANPSGVNIDQVECNYDQVANVFRPIVTVFRFRHADFDAQDRVRVNVNLLQVPGGSMLGQRVASLLNDDGTILPNGLHPVPLGESRRFTTQVAAPLGDAASGGPLTPDAEYIVRAGAFDVLGDTVFVGKGCRAGMDPNAWDLAIEAAYRWYIDAAVDFNSCPRLPPDMCVGEDPQSPCEVGLIALLIDPSVRACYQALAIAVDSPPLDVPTLGFFRQILNITCGAARSAADYRCNHFADTYTDFPWGDDWVYLVMNGYLVLHNAPAEANLRSRVAEAAGPTLQAAHEACQALPDWLVPAAGAIGAASAVCAPIEDFFSAGDLGALEAGAPHFAKELDPQFREQSKRTLEFLPLDERRSSAAATFCAIRRQQEDLFKFAVGPGFDDDADAGLISDAGREVAKKLVPVAAGLFRDFNFREILVEEFGTEEGHDAYLEYWRLCGGGPPNLITLVPEILDDIGRTFRLTFPSLFWPLSWLDVFLFSDPTYLGTVQTNADGTVTIEVAVPDGVPGGDHVVEVRGRGADGSPVTLGVSIPVGEPTTTTSTTAPTVTTTSSTTTTLPIGQGLTGTRLVLRDNPDPSRRFAAGVSKDPSIDLGGGDGSADDPTVHGGTLRLVTEAGEVFDVKASLPAAFWVKKGKTPNTGYKYKDRAAVGPVKTAIVKPGPKGALVKFILKGNVALSLATDPNPVSVIMTLGGKQYCMTFGGRVSFRPGVAWTARDAQQAACP